MGPLKSEYADALGNYQDEEEMANDRGVNLGDMYEDEDKD
jgi:hypothetical protein